MIGNPKTDAQIIYNAKRRLVMYYHAEEMYDLLVKIWEAPCDTLIMADFQNDIKDLTDKIEKGL